MTKENLVKFIIEKLQVEKDRCYKQFQNNNSQIKTKYFIIDNLLPEKITCQIYNAFSQNRDLWREIKSLREKKLTSKQLDNFPKILTDITFALQDVRVIKKIEDITGFNELLGDDNLYAGGLSKMHKGDFLNPHIDNSHDSNIKNYRALNLLYYVTPDWKVEFGGNFELWDISVKNKITIPSFFNRLVVMETNNFSFHSVNKIVTNKSRCCVSNYYYFKRNSYNKKYFHVTSFTGRPKEYIKRILLPFDTIIRNNIRKIIKRGFSKHDIYKK